MSFRIRQDPDTSDYEANQIVYRAHLDKIRGSLPPDLWRYFAVDFFHDGRIDGIDLGVRTTVSLWCPNIRRVTEPEKHEYVNACFQCEFRDVVWAEYLVSGESNDDAGTPQFDRPLFFSMGEIDSLADKIDRAERLRSIKYHSLVIQMRPVGLELTLVFGGVVVKALEPLAFALLSSDARYHLPIAR